MRSRSRLTRIVSLVFVFAILAPLKMLILDATTFPNSKTHWGAALLIRHEGDPMMISDSSPDDMQSIYFGSQNFADVDLKASSLLGSNLGCALQPNPCTRHIRLRLPGKGSLPVQLQALLDPTYDSSIQSSSHFHHGRQTNIFSYLE